MDKPWKNEKLSLGERCVLFSENEMKNNVKEDKPNSFTSQRIREYFSICTRLTNGKEVPINLGSGNWCSSGSCYAMHECLLPNEIPPHGYRVGVVEVVSDLQKNGLWRPVSMVKNGSWKPMRGDVVVFDRSNPSNPASSWWRHFGRIFEVIDDKTFKCISGNNGGCWKIDVHNFNEAKLLGFGEYPRAIKEIIPEVIDPAHDFTNVNFSTIEHFDTTITKEEKVPSNFSITTVINFFLQFFK